MLRTSGKEGFQENIEVKTPKTRKKSEKSNLVQNKREAPNCLPKYPLFPEGRIQVIENPLKGSVGGFHLQILLLEHYQLLDIQKWER